jgi:hypothetical protein
MLGIILNLLLGLSLLCWGGAWAQAPSSGVPQEPVTTPSVIELPLRISLTPLFTKVEQAVPEQAGNWRVWREWHGIQTQYQAWRGKLAFRMEADTLLVQAHVRYWVRARASLLNTVEIKGSCGVGREAPRQAVIGVRVRLRWLPDWSLYPEFKVLPTRFLDRCEMTAAGVDVTPLIEDEFRKQLEAGLRSALSVLSPRVNEIRARAAKVWTALQGPIELQPGNWLLLRPAAIAFSPFRGEGEVIQMRLALAMYPLLVAGERPDTSVMPLPPLQQYWPGSPEVYFQLSMNIDFDAIGGQILKALQGRKIEIKDRTITVESVEIKGKRQELSARVQLGGDAAGTAQVWANVVFSVETQQLVLADLEYVSDHDDPQVALFSDLLYERLRGEMETTANQLLEQQFQQWRELLAARIHGLVDGGLRVDFSSLRLNSVQVNMDEGGIQLQGVAVGAIAIEVPDDGTVEL